MSGDRRTAVLTALKAREHELLDFACELIGTASPNPPGDERAVVKVVGDALRSFGYRDIEVLARDPRRPNLLARIGQDGGPSLILSGHLDTKPAGHEAAWRTPPCAPTLLDGRLHGLGAADMKGAVAAMVFAGRALAEADALPGCLRLVLTADEEAGAAFGASFLAGRIPTADAILVGEPTGIERPWEYLAVASRGVACFRVVVRGTAMHSSLTDRLPAVNASVKLSEVLVRFAEEFRPTWQRGRGSSPWAPAVNAGVTLHGGVFYGVCPGEAEFGVDVRTVPGMTLPQLQADVETFFDSLRREDPSLDVTVEWPPERSWFPPSSIDAGHPLLAAARRAAARTLGRELPDGVFPGGTEGAIWATAGMDVLPALGPGRLVEAHRPNESVGVDELVTASRIYALTALDFLDGSAA